MKATGVPLNVRENLKEPYRVEEWQAQLDKKKAGPIFKKDASKVQAALDSLTQDFREKLSLSLEKEGEVEIDVADVEGGKVKLNKDVVSIQKESRVVNTREYIPNVIEPSFGIGRILYSLMEHAYWTREGDAARSVMSFLPTVAPIKVLLVPLQKDARFAPVVESLEEQLDDRGISYDTDSSGVSIGKRYSRNDELGIPCGITVDYQSLEDGTFTLRDRDTTKQVRAKAEDILDAVEKMTLGRWTWADVQAKLPAFEGKEEETKEE
jgi:glycyl-tRNA synthetase